MTTLLDDLGGRPAVDLAVAQLLPRLLADPLLSPYFAATDVRRLTGHQRAFLVLPLGDGEAPASLRAAHAGRGITSAAFNPVVGHLVNTLAALGVPGAVAGRVVARLAPLREDVVGHEPALLAL